MAANANVPPATRTVWVVIPDNDRGKSVSRITVRSSPVSDKYLAGPDRDCAIIPADMSIDAARVMAKWVAEYDAARRGV
jgi:hypothetical protein